MFYSSLISQFYHSSAVNSSINLDYHIISAAVCLIYTHFQVVNTINRPLFCFWFGGTFISLTYFNGFNTSIPFMIVVLILEVPQKNFSIVFNKVVISKIIFKIGKMYIHPPIKHPIFFCGTSRIIMINLPYQYRTYI